MSKNISTVLMATSSPARARREISGASISPACCPASSAMKR
jgi:hypothetical protein